MEVRDLIGEKDGWAYWVIILNWNAIYRSTLVRVPEGDSDLMWTLGTRYDGALEFVRYLHRPLKNYENVTSCAYMRDLSL